MKSRPILFSALMVRALLAGTKTQTRRTVKPQPEIWTQRVTPLCASAPNTFVAHGKNKLSGPDSFDGFKWASERQEFLRKSQCAYGAPGDRLWVREEHYRFGHWEEVPGVRTKGGRQKWKFVADTDEVRYDDNAPESFRKGRHHKDPATPAWHKRLARFMPRALSRITMSCSGVPLMRKMPAESSRVTSFVRPFVTTR
jgi:hypothetical protein